jgi:hypothetical protein
MANVTANSMKKLSIATTVLDAAMAFRRGNPRRGAVLLGAAALSTRAPGLGTLASIGYRVYQRLR